jgi:Skp family chaperone for outer membrane proteins
MAIELFGFRVGRDEEVAERNAQQIPTFTPPPNVDGAMEVAPGGAYGTFVDMEGVAKNEAELITRYREMSMYPECESAIDDVVNEALITDDQDEPISLNLDNLKQPDSVKKRIQEEFDTILKLLDFNNMGYELFRRWYIDGRLFYHIMVDINNPRKGIQELRYIDPRRIRKIRQPLRRTPIVGQNSKLIVPAYEEYYLYNLAGMSQGTMTQGVKVSKDAICYVHSGLLDARNRMVLSYLHKAIKPLNQLRMLEDAVVIYRLARAPERRIFYIDVGNLPKAKAEQYVRDMMVKHKNRLVYDADTGAVKDSRKFMTMLEDYWLPRREGGRGTEITTLPGGENLGQMEDVDYFRKKLYKSLSVPVSRLEPEGTFSMGRSGEISRDEIKFAKFIERLRDRFTHLFDNLLEIQLLLTGVMTREEWKDMKNDIKYSFQRDNYYSEIKEQDMINNRLAVLGIVDAYVGKYYSVEWIRKNILRQTDEEIQEMDKQMAAEGEVQAAAEAEMNDQQMQQQQMQQDAEAKAANNQAKKEKSAPQQLEIKVKQEAPSAKKIKEDYIPHVARPLTEEDKKLIESMTRAIEKVSKEDLEYIEKEFRDDD